MEVINSKNFSKLEIVGDKISIYYIEDYSEKMHDVKYSDIVKLSEYVLCDDLFTVVNGHINNVPFPALLLNLNLVMSENESWNYNIKKCLFEFSGLKTKSNKMIGDEYLVWTKTKDYLPRKIALRILNATLFTKGSALWNYSLVKKNNPNCILLHTSLLNFIVPNKSIIDMYDVISARVNYVKKLTNTKEIVAFVNRISQNGLMIHVNTVNYDHDTQHHAVMTYKFDIPVGKEVYWLTGISDMKQELCKTIDNLTASVKKLTESIIKVNMIILENADHCEELNSTEKETDNDDYVPEVYYQYSMEKQAIGHCQELISVEKETDKINIADDHCQETIKPTLISAEKETINPDQDIMKSIQDIIKGKNNQDSEKGDVIFLNKISEEPIDNADEIIEKNRETIRNNVEWINKITKLITIGGTMLTGTLRKEILNKIKRLDDENRELDEKNRELSKI